MKHFIRNLIAGAFGMAAVLMTFTACSEIDEEPENVGEESPYCFSGDIVSADLDILQQKDCYIAEYNNTPIYRKHGDSLYLLGTKIENGLVYYYLDRVDLKDYTISSIDLSEVSDKGINSFDEYGDGLVFQCGDDELIFTDSEAKVKKTVRIDSEESGTSPSQIYSGGDGRIYLVKSQMVEAYDSEGIKIDGYSCNGEKYILRPILKAEGELILPVLDEERFSVAFLGGDELGGETIGEIPAENIWSIVDFAGEKIYYRDNKCLYSWDTVSGEVSQIVSLDVLGLNAKDEIIPIKDDGERKSFYCIKERNHWISILGKNSDEDIETINVRIIGSLDDSVISFLKSSAAAFSRKNPGYTVNFETVGNEDYDRDKFLLESIDDEPGLMLVSQDDLRILADKDLIGSLDSVLGNETYDSLLPCVKELGTVNDIYFGLAPVIYINTLYTNRNTWLGDSWTIEDICELIDKNADTEVFSYSYGGMFPEQLLYYLAEMDLEGNGYYDQRQGKSNFEEGGFEKVLKIAKDYSAENIDGDGAKKVAEGKSLALWMPTFSAYEYAENCALVGEGGFAVGFPTKKGKGSYAQSNAYLVVKKGSEEEECLGAFLEYVASANNQCEINGGGISIRKDMSKYCISYDENRKCYVWDAHNGFKYNLPKDIDIEAFKKQWDEFLLSAEPLRTDSKILGIVDEEAQSFFYGSKDADDTVRVIDSRVQLLLDENR